MLAALLLYVLAPRAWAGPCPVPASTAEIAEGLDQAEAAWRALDVDGFQDAMDELTLVVPCAGEIVDPQLAVRLHRAVALRRYRSGGIEAALPSLRAARVLDPGGAFFEDVLPPGHELRAMAEAQIVDEGRRQRVPVPQGIELWFDGRPGNVRPADRATVFQEIHGADGVAFTRYLRPGDALPTYDLRPRKTRIALGIVSGVLAASAGAMYGGAWAEFGDYRALPEGDPALAGSRATSMGLTGAAVAAAAGAVGTGIAAAVGPR